MPKIMVFPTKPESMNVHHPMDGKLKVGGSLWEYDGETCNGIVGGWLTDDPEKQWHPDDKPEEAE